MKLPKPFHTKDFLKREYIDRGRSTYNIARQFGVSVRAVQVWLKKHNITKEPFREFNTPKKWNGPKWKTRTYATKAQIENWELKPPTDKDVKRAEKLGEQRMNDWLGGRQRADIEYQWRRLDGSIPNEDWE